YCALDLAEAVSNAIEGFDHVEIVVDRFELFAQPLDVAVNRSVVYIDLFVIRCIHQSVAALYHTWALRKSVEDQELRDRQRDRLTFPGAGMALLVHCQVASFQRAGRFVARFCREVASPGTSQNSTNTLYEQPLRKGLPHDIIGPHLQAKEFINLVVFRCQEDDGYIALLAKSSQQFHAVHPRHLDIEDSQRWWTSAQPFQRRCTVCVSLNSVTLGLKRD